MNARTLWGDTAAHYAARSGTFEALTFLCEKGIYLHKKDFFIDQNFIDELAEKYELTQVRTYLLMKYTLLKKAELNVIGNTYFLL